MGCTYLEWRSEDWLLTGYAIYVWCVLIRNREMHLVTNGKGETKTTALL